MLLVTALGGDSRSRGRADGNGNGTVTTEGAMGRTAGASATQDQQGDPELEVSGKVRRRYAQAHLLPILLTILFKCSKSLLNECDTQLLKSKPVQREHAATKKQLLHSFKAGFFFRRGKAKAVLASTLSHGIFGTKRVCWWRQGLTALRVSV